MFQRLSEYIDGELDPELCERFDRHMGDCAPCVAFVESLRRTVALLRRSPGARLTDARKKEIVEAWNRLREEGKG
jgi:RNA polymerase sigma-70 factor (ECF subfamily)